MTTRMPTVAVVGGGPVGLTLALVLARLDVPSVVIEARPHPTQGDRERALEAAARASGLAHAAAHHPLAEALIDDYCREQRAASAQVQLENELIFRNLALRPGALAAVRTLLVRLLGRVPLVGARMAATATLVAQHVPTRNARDWTGIEPCRPVRAWGEWHAGRRAPLAALRAWPALRGASPRATHLVVPLAGPAACDLARTVAARSPIPAAAAAGTPECRAEGADVVAIIRPDQEVAALLPRPR
jgi:glycine/D-amino acid oxidase-like deaminating enzyme